MSNPNDPYSQNPYGQPNDGQPPQYNQPQQYPPQQGQPYPPQQGQPYQQQYVPPQKNGRVPGASPDFVESIGMAVILSILTCGIYALFWHAKQIRAINSMLGRDEFSFVLWFFLSLFTCGIFAWYYEYKMAMALNDIKAAAGRHFDSNLPLICLLISIFASPIITMAIEQGEINGLCDISRDF